MHVLRIRRSVEGAENQAQSDFMLGLYSALGTDGEEPLEALVPKSPDRHRNQCNVCGYRSQSRSHVGVALVLPINNAVTVTAQVKTAANLPTHKRQDLNGGALAPFTGTALAPPVPAPGFGVKPVRAEALEHGLARLLHHEVLAADRLHRLLLPRARRDDGDDAVGVGKGESLEKRPVDDAEHRRPQTDAEAEREHGDERQRRVFQEKAKS